MNQTGGNTYPKANGGWAQEISLDLDMASAICPNCKVLLVEANSSYMSDLGTAVNTAAAKEGATATSNSYGGNEYSGETADEASYFNHPGIAVTVSSGDDGYGVEFPASSQYVTAVGGTTLTKDSTTTRGWSETVWSGAGSGCSAYISKPSWQTDTGCSRRTVGDVAAVADPYSGVAVYDSYTTSGDHWLVFGGTSVASPIIASVYALAGNAATVTMPDSSTGAGGYGSYPYSNTSSLYDVTSGSNGVCGYVTRRRHHHKRKVFVASLQYLCHGETDYDAPTGNGTPNGTDAF